MVSESRGSALAPPLLTSCWLLVVGLSSEARTADPPQAWYSWPKRAEPLRTHTRTALQSHCGNILLLCSVPLVRLALASAASSRAQTGAHEQSSSYSIREERRISFFADFQNKTAEHYSVDGTMRLHDDQSPCSHRGPS